MKLKPSIKIVLTVGNKTHRLALIPQPWRGRYWLRYNGRKSEKMPESTISKLMEECRKIIVAAEKDRK
jgi:hypothetical protein